MEHFAGYVISRQNSEEMGMDENRFFNEDNKKNHTIERNGKVCQLTFES